MIIFCLGSESFPTTQLIWFNSELRGDKDRTDLRLTCHVTRRTTPRSVRSQLHACTYRRINILRESHCWAELHAPPVLRATQPGSGSEQQPSTFRLSTLSSNTFRVS
jgi:hypothetical protein